MRAPVLAAAIAFALLTPPTLAQQRPPPGPRPTLPPDAGTTADARLLRAIDLYTGVAGRVDDGAARALLEAVGSDGSDPLARMWIARVHSRGRMTFERDEARAAALAAEVITEVRSLAAAGDVEAQFLMGTAYDEGLGVRTDYGEAMRWYRRAAARGHVLATHNVGNMHRDGRGVDIDHALAAMWWLRAARAGDAIPALRLGEAFEAGRGVTRDLERARFWYGRAADRGNPSAPAALRRLGGSAEARSQRGPTASRGSSTRLSADHDGRIGGPG
ncbi:MAG: sel1 repeat family protein [Gemmatimonadota bacterium]|nr:sel1 repeat family protein [Gemmatimonadota bacterium]